MKRIVKIANEFSNSVINLKNIDSEIECEMTKLSDFIAWQNWMKIYMLLFSALSILSIGLLSFSAYFGRLNVSSPAFIAPTILTTIILFTTIIGAIVSGSKNKAAIAEAEQSYYKVIDEFDEYQNSCDAKTSAPLNELPSKSIINSQSNSLTKGRSDRT